MQWEEVLYRGFALPAIALLVKSYRWSVFLQGLLFSIHHVSLNAALPLAVLGWTWALLYRTSGNLLTPIIVHGKLPGIFNVLHTIHVPTYIHKYIICTYL